MAIESKPDENPEFALLDQNDPVTGQANVAEPPTAKKNYGWAYLEKPGHNWMNWLHRKTSEWLTYFNQYFSATHQFQINEIIEYDTDNGVAIEGVELKDNDITTSGGIATGGNSTKLAWKVIEIGDWDMDADNTVLVGHGFSGDDWKNIRSISVIIRRDDDAQYADINSFSVQSSENITHSLVIAGASIYLTRDLDGFFDGTDYDSTSFNRGWITIAYEV